MTGIEILTPIVALLGIGFVVIYISRLLRLSPIVGFVIAGIAIGPHGLGLLEESKITHFLTELGVAFLLFDIGLHFSTKSAWKLRRDLFGLAPFQFFLSGLVLGFSVAFIFNVEAKIAMLTGLTLALSSTAVVMQIIADLKQTESPVGQSAKAVLIFQDLAAIFLLMFADAVSGDAALAGLLISTVIKTGAAFAGAVILGQYILTPLMKSIIKYDDPEMFTVLGLLIVMMTGLATSSIGLSLTLGAFLAGMVLAETPFRVLLQTELRPFRSLLLGLFFITIGTLMNPLAIWESISLIIALTALLIAVKAALIGALVFIMKRPVHQTIQTIFLLSQGSEFAFVIFSLATVKAALGISLAEQLITAVALSMMLTPLLTFLGHRYSLYVCNKFDTTICNDPGNTAKSPGNRPVFIIGMNEVGKTLARAFRAHRIPYIAIDNNRQRFLEATAAGYIVSYGQPDDLRFWNSLGVSQAKAICIASPSLEKAQALTPVVKKIYPLLKRYVAVSDSAEGVRFAALGLRPFNNKGAPPGLEMACFILQEFKVEEEEIANWSEEEQSAYLGSNKFTEDEDAAAMAAE